MRQLRWLSGNDDEFDPLTKKIIENNGSVDEKSLEEYGATAGAMGGAAVCVAFGVSAGAAAVCGMVGGKIGAWIASKIPWAKGSTINDVILDTWNQAVARNKRASRGILAVKAYMTYRAALPAILGISEKEVNEDLAKRGFFFNIPSVLPRWKPVPGRWEWGQELLAGEGISTQECNIVKKTMSCGDYWFFVNNPYGPIGRAGHDAIDWSIVGMDEASFSEPLWKDIWLGGYNYLPKLQQSPSAMAAVWVKVLQDYEVEKKKQLQTLRTLQIMAEMNKPKTKPVSPVVKAATAGGIGYVIWWLWKTFR